MNISNMHIMRWFWFVLIFCAVAGLEKVLGAWTVKQLSYCSMEINGGVINLESLGRRGEPRLTAEFGEAGKSWNYTYNPCYEFDMPENPKDGFGDKCLSAALCKYGQQGTRMYYYTMGFQRNVRFLASVGRRNRTEVRLKFQAYSSLEGKATYIMLVCNRTLTEPDAAIFRINRDQKGLGDVEGELHHLCSCINGCTDGLDPALLTNTSVITSIPKEDGDIKISNRTKADDDMKMSNRMKADDDMTISNRKKAMIIVGVNVGVIVLAVIFGLLCYNKKPHLEIYKKLPGIRITADPDTAAWQLASVNDLDLGNNPETGTSLHEREPRETSVTGSTTSTKPTANGMTKAGYRDYEPRAARRKSRLFPVLQHCNIPEECLSLGQRLGGNLFGDTYIGEWTGVKVAIKRITLSVHENQLNVGNIKGLQDEILFLSRQRHRNIVSLLGLCSATKHPYIISEYAEGQCVKDFIKQSGSQLTWTHRVKILSQVADGMAFLHSTSPPLLHRDLRCANMFVNDNDVTKVADFGIVKLTQPLRQFCQIEDCCCQGQYSACPFSIGWTAPEVLEHPNSMESEDYITTACDVYSYAVVMWELVMCDDPYDDMSTAQEVIEHVISGGRPDISSSRSLLKPYKDLMTSCWSTNTADRPIFKQVTVHLKEIMHQARAFQKSVNNGHLPV